MRGLPFLRSQARQLLPVAAAAKAEAVGKELQSGNERWKHHRGEAIACADFDILDSKISLLATNVDPRQGAAAGPRDRGDQQQQRGQHVEAQTISDSQAGSVSEGTLPADNGPPPPAAALGAAAAEKRHAAAASPDGLQNLTPPPQIRARSPDGATTAAPTAYEDCKYCGCLVKSMSAHLPLCALAQGRNPSSAAARGTAGESSGGGDGERFHSGQSWDEGAGASVLGTPTSSMKLLARNDGRPLPAAGDGRLPILKRKRDVEELDGNGGGATARSKYEEHDTVERKLVYNVEQNAVLSRGQTRTGAAANYSSVVKEKEQYKALLQSAKKDAMLLRQEKEKVSRELKMTEEMRETDVKRRKDVVASHKKLCAEVAALKKTNETLNDAFASLQHENEQLKVQIQEVEKRLEQAEERHEQAKVELEEERKQNKMQLRNVEQGKDQACKEASETVARLQAQQKGSAKALKAKENEVKAARKAEKRYQKELAKLREVAKLREELLRKEKELNIKLASCKKAKDELDAELQVIKIVRKEDKEKADARIGTLLAHEKEMASEREKLEEKLRDSEQLRQRVFESLGREQEDKQQLLKKHESTLKQHEITLSSCQKEGETRVQKMLEEQRRFSLQQQELRTQKIEESHRLRTQEIEKSYRFSLQQQELRTQKIEESHRLQMEALEKQKKKVDEVLLEKAELQREKEAETQAFLLDKEALKKETAKFQHLLENFMLEKVLLEKQKEESMSELLREHEVSKVEWQSSMKEALVREEECRQELSVAKNETLMLYSVMRENEDLRAQVNTAKLTASCLLSLARRHDDHQKEVKLANDRLVWLTRENDNLKDVSWGLRERLLALSQEKERLEAQLTLQLTLQEEKTLAVEALRTEKEALQQRLQCAPVLQQSSDYESALCKGTSEVPEQDVEFPVCVENREDEFLVEPMNEDLPQGAECRSAVGAVEPMDGDQQQGVESYPPSGVVLAVDEDVLHFVECTFPVCEAEPSTIMQHEENKAMSSGLEIVLYSGPDNRTQFSPSIYVMPGIAGLSMRHMARMDVGVGTATAIVPYRPLQIRDVDQDSD